MKAFFNAVKFWLPILIYKIFAPIFKAMWNFNLWILQKISDTPLYYSRPESRIPAIVLGTIGIILSATTLFFLLFFNPANAAKHGFSVWEVVINGFLGLGFLVACRFLIKRGAI